MPFGMLRKPLITHLQIINRNDSSNDKCFLVNSKRANQKFEFFSNFSHISMDIEAFF